MSAAKHAECWLTRDNAKGLGRTLWSTDVEPWQDEDGCYVAADCGDFAEGETDIPDFMVALLPKTRRGAKKRIRITIEQIA